MTNCPSFPVSEGCSGCQTFGAKTETLQGKPEWMVAHNCVGVFLKVHATLQRSGSWPFHVLSAGEFSQKPLGLKPFVLVSYSALAQPKGNQTFLK